MWGSTPHMGRYMGWKGTTLTNMQVSRTAGAAILIIAFMVSQAHASQKIALYPFELDIPATEEDFFIGEKKANAEEEARLGLIRTEFEKALKADGRYEVVDLAPLKEEITQAQPLRTCNDCDVEIAKKAGAELALLGIVNKVSETHLNLIVQIREVATGATVNSMQVVVQGNTDDTWLHGARWLLKNRLLVSEENK